MPNESQGNSDKQPGLDELIPLSKAVKLSGLSPSRLRYLVSNGEIWGVKPGRNWFTTEQAVKEYLARDRRTGPKSKKGVEPSSKKA